MDSVDSPQLNFSRTEYKYLITPNLAERLKRYFAVYMVPDKYNLDERPYDINSIYFDSPSLVFGKDKIEGATERIKIRVRGYRELKSGISLFLELKKKNGDRIHKERRLISQDNFSKLMNGETSFLLDGDNAFFKEVWYLFHYYRLSPKVANWYQRYSLVDRLINCKVSFDSDFSASSLGDKNMLQFKPVKNDIIMEIKFDRYVPDYFLRMVKRYGLVKVSSSKYLLSLQKSYCKYSFIIKN